MEIVITALIFIIWFEVRVMPKLDAVSAAITDLAGSISAEIQRVTDALTAALQGTDTELAAEVTGVVKQLTDLKAQVDAVLPATPAAP